MARRVEKLLRRLILLLERLEHHRPGTRLRIDLAEPVILERICPMSVTKISSSQIAYFPILMRDSSGAVQPIPASDTLSVLGSNDAAVAFSISSVPSTDDAGNPISNAGAVAVKAVPLVLNTDPAGVNFEVSDSIGSVPTTETLVASAAAVSALNISVDTGNVVLVKQTPPSA